jgi:tetratricopeptide (TPR) repeat protein
MKNIVYTKPVSAFIICLISLIIIIPNRGFSTDKFWVPEFPPKSNYEIKAKINITDTLIEGEEIITFINASNQDIKIIAFDWSISEKSTIKISSNGELLALLNSGENETLSSPLIYSLKYPIKAGKKAQLKVEFSSNTLFKNTEEIKLISWYPRLWWDAIDTFDSYKIKLDIPDDYALAISGRLNKKTGSYENNGVRTCGIYLRKGLLTEQKEIEGVMITSLHTKKGSECARLSLETAADAIKFYKEWLGFYPFKFLYILPGDDRPMGGYPFASGIVVIHGQDNFQQKPLLHWKWITAHEIGHQYWGEYVFDNYNSWLWIGLGIYADREYSIYRNLSLEKHTGMMDKYIAGVMKKYDTTADLTHSQIEKIDFDYNNIIKHGKGFSIISALECVLGKDIFVKSYKRCLKEYKGIYLSYNDFWEICEEESGKNLAWFFEQWVRSDKYLFYEIISQSSIQKNNHFISTIKIKSVGTLKMPIPVKVIFEDSSSQTKITNRLLDINNIVFKSKSKMKEAIVDPDKKLAMITDTLFLSPEELIERINQLPWQGVKDEAVRLFLKAKKMQLRDRQSWYKLGLVLFNSRNDPEALFAFQIALLFNQNDFATLVWLGHMNDLNSNREEALKFYKKAIKNDKGETIVYDQFGLKINRKWVEERLSTPYTHNQEER